MDESETSLDQYVLGHRIELGRSLEGKHRVYLDTRYWILIRDAALARSRIAASSELLSQLRRLVAEGKAFCPFSEPLFVELMKQKDLYTRRETAKLVDELSIGICLAPEEERVGTELAHLFYSSMRPNAVYNRNWLVWLKSPFVLGISHPTNTGFDARKELEIQKMFFDRMWESVCLVQMLDLLGDGEFPSSMNFDALAKKLNRDGEIHAHQIRSFKQAYGAEIAGALNVFMDRAIEILAQMRQRETGNNYTYTTTERAECKKLLHTILTNAMRLGGLAKQLPTLHVQAMCHAVYRWDKHRKFESNDFFDFHHANAALGYCDLFLTERDLRTVLSSDLTALDEKLSCLVISSIDEAVDHLNRL